MNCKLKILAALATLSLVAASLAATGPGNTRGEDPLACPFCGGTFRIESFSAELGCRLAVRVARAYSGH